MENIENVVPNIFILNVDCFELVFEWLSLKELLVFRRTCKRMKAVVDYYIKLNYPRLMQNQRDLFNFSRIRLECFEWIKHLKLSDRLTYNQIETIKYILNQLESLVLFYVQINGDLYENLLKYCPRLKYLSVRTNTKIIIGTGNEWLLRKYPELEHFHIVFKAPLHREQLRPSSELLTFLEQNPNVRMFSTNCTLFLIYRDMLLRSNIKLDRLYIDILTGDNLNSICNSTNDLYEQGFYKKLHLEVNECQRDLPLLWSLRNLEKLTCRSLWPELLPPVVESLNEVSFNHIRSALSNTPMIMGRNLINLKRVNFQSARLREIQLLVAHAPRLAQIRVYRHLYGMLEEMGNEPNVDNFFALNEERKNLAGSCKVTIYIKEKLYFKMKWSAKVKFSRIELKRINSCAIEHISMEEDIL